MTPPTGSPPGLPQNDADRADNAWVRETAAAAVASRPAHKTMVEWQPGDWFRAWCGTCGKFVTAKGRDKARIQYEAGAHERSKAGDS